MNPTTPFTDCTGEQAVAARVPLRRTPSGIAQRLLARARKQKFQRGDSLIVGFSGGRDSLVLAASLRWLNHVLSIRPILVHVDHRLRAESERDAGRAMELANCLGLEAVVRRLGEHPSSVHPGVGIEEAARRERYRVLFEEASARTAVAVVTAHHQSDQAETVLMHLLRGGGVHGAGGMAEWSLPASRIARCQCDISQEKNDRDAGLWRPFLHESRAEIDLELQGLGLKPIEDASNADLELRRNALRHEVLPVLERHFPGATAALARYAELAAEDDRALQEVVEDVYASVVDPGGHFRLNSVFDQPLAVQRRLLREWILRSTGIDMVSAERTSAVHGLLEYGETGKFVEIGEGWSVHRAHSALVVENICNDGKAREEGE